MEAVLSRILDQEGRIAKVEHKTDDLIEEFKGIKDLISEGNKDQSLKLDLIHDRMLDEFFVKKRSIHDTKMSIYAKSIGVVVGSGGILYVIWEFVASKFIGG